MPGLNAKYHHTRGFDPAKLQTAIASFIQINERNSATTVSIANATRLINRLGSDTRVTDIRWMAYMLATNFLESRETQTFQIAVPARPATAKKAATQATTRDIKLWVLFNPIDETGQGRGKQYYEAVKVERIADGAILTERDGDQFKVSNAGQVMKAAGMTTNMADRGSVSGGVASKKYTDAVGTPLQYFGRGLVQITWWNSYVSAGVAMGVGLDLLFDPEKVKDFNVAYEIMILGMVNGLSYANGLKCSMYFTDTRTNYVGARAMINGTDKAQVIADLAVSFEKLLLDARLLAR